MFSEHLSSLPVDGFFKVTPAGNSVTIKHASDGFVWPGFSPHPPLSLYHHWLSPLWGLAALPGETPILSLLPHCISGCILTGLSFSHLLVALKRPHKINNERCVAWGVAQGLCKETCFPQVLMSMGQVALVLCKVLLSPYGYTAV